MDGARRVDRRSWNQAIRIVGPAGRNGCSVLTSDASGATHLTSIESLLLNDEPGSAIYVVTPGTAELSRRLDVCRELAVIAWTPRSSVLKGIARRKRNGSGVKLLGRAGRRRKATPTELDSWLRVVASRTENAGHPRMPSREIYVRALRFEEIEFLDEGPKVPQPRAVHQDTLDLTNHSLGAVS